MDHHLDAVVLDVVAGEGGLEGLEGVLGQGLATGIDVSVQVAAELLGLGVEGGPAGDGDGVGIVVGSDDGHLVNGCNKNRNISNNCNVILKRILHILQYYLGHSSKKATTHLKIA